MATLLHIDSSLNGETSTSRSVTGAFRTEWEAQNPGGTVIYRDLSADPLPHLDLTGFGAAFAPRESHTAEQSRAMALREELAGELERADTVLIGAPMYNYAIPSTLKAWIDQVTMAGRTMGERPSAAGTPAVVVASRGGAYGPGTPREGFDFVRDYLDKVLGGTLGLKVEFIVPELTMARSNPAMAALVEQADASRAAAHEAATRRAKELSAG